MRQARLQEGHFFSQENPKPVFFFIPFNLDVTNLLLFLHEPTTLCAQLFLVLSLEQIFRAVRNDVSILSYEKFFCLFTWLVTLYIPFSIEGMNPLSFLLQIMIYKEIN